MKKLLGLIVLSACFLSMVPVLAAPVTSAPLMTAAEFKEREEENRNKVEFKRNAAETKVTFQKAEGDKCGRCWKVLPEVGENKEHPTLCIRCAEAVKQQKQKAA